MKSKYIVLLAMTCPGLALAGTPISETRAVSDDARIEITNVKGAVNVSAWDKAEVAISGTLGDGSKGLAIEGEGSHLQVRVEGTDKSKAWFHWGSDAAMEESVLNLKVPRKASLEINVVSADVSVVDLTGRSIEVDSVSGKVRLNASSERLRVDSVSGDVEFDGKAGETNIETVSGDVSARGVGGRTRLETVSGTVRIEASTPLSDASAGSVSGDIEIRGALDKKGRIHVESMSGDVRLNLPADLSARIQAETFSGTLRSDFGAVEKREHGPGSNIDASVGNGDGDINIDSFSGSVTLHRE
ncbi:MAG: DUF4097 family beta strand repeat-containing protein [Tahibacter sp.]